MIEAVYIAATGLTGQQRRMDNIANNIANINTTGFKSTRLDFKDAIYNNLTRVIQPQEDLNMRKGHGLMTAATTRDLAMGSINPTGNQLDFVIEGGGFFKLEKPDGSNVYTRNGAFCLSVEGESRYLVSSDGFYVLDDAGAKIDIPPEAQGIGVSSNGTITIEGQEPSVRLGLYTFPNEQGLDSVGLSTFVVSENSGEEEPVESPRIRQGAIENSNVNLALEMTRMIRAQRALTLASRALRTADEMEGIANGIKR